VVKLKRLKIRRYRDVEPCELVFSDRFNVLLGANGAGKTTLLDLVSKVLRTNLDDGSDPLSIVVELAFPGGTLTGTIESVDDTRTTPPELRVARAARPASPQVAQLPMFSFRIERFEPASIVEIRLRSRACVGGRFTPICLHRQRLSSGLPMTLVAEFTMTSTTRGGLMSRSTCFDPWQPGRTITWS